MRTKSFSVKKLLSLVLAIAMMATMILPTSVFAAAPAVDGKAVATVLKGATDTELVKQITVAFDAEIKLNDVNFNDVNVTVNNDNEIGASTAVVDATDEKKLVITLADDATVEVGDTITFANNVIVDKATETDAFNDSVEVTGSLTPATVALNAPVGVTATVDGGITEFGVGTYTYSASGAGFESVSNVEFDIEASDLGTEKTVTVAMTEVVPVGFTATAVATNVAATYGKADKVVLVFAEPIDATAEEVFAQLDINAKTKDPVWTVDKTVLTLTVDGDIENGTVVNYAKNAAIKTTSGKIVADGSATIEGNFVGAEDLVTATSMTATIVKGAPFKPEVQDADSIVLVFNAPVATTGDLSIVVGEGTDVVTLTATGDVTKTVYTINLDGSEEIENATKIAYGTIETSINGSFGVAEAPNVLKAVAVDNDGTALTEGDSIIVYFDRNTNSSTTGTLTGNLAGAAYEWINAQTLKITLADAAISSEDTIDISAIAIKDSYGLIDATGLTNISLEGGFGHAIKPEIARVSAVSVTGNPTAAQGDKIVVAFNTVVDHSDVTDISVSGGNLGNGFTIDWNDDETTVAIITLGAGSPKVEVGTTAIRFDGTIWDVTHTLKLTNQDYTVSHGAWGVTITPELMSATIVKTSSVPTVQAGDEIVLVFTTPTNGENIIPLLQDELSGASGVWSANNTIYTITLAESTEITDADDIVFDNDQEVNGQKIALKDVYGVSKVNDKMVDLKGSFGKANIPELLSATIVKTQTTPKAQKGDQIVFVFSAMTNGGKKDIESPNIITSLSHKFGSNAKGEWSVKGTVYTVTLGDGPTITDVDTITLTENSGFRDVHEIVTVKGGTPIALDGTFGEEVVQNLQVSSVIAYSEGSKNKVKVIFNVETNLTTVANASFKTALGEANKVADKCIFGEEFDIDVTAQELVITLDNAGYSVTDATVLNLAGLGIKSVSGGELTGTIPACDGYFVPVVEDVVVQDDGVTVVVYFSARTDGNKDAAKAAILAQKALFGSTANQNVEWKNNNTELHITMSDDNTMADDAYIVLNDFEIYDEFSKTHKVVGQYNVDTEKLDYKVLTFVVYANAINTENAAREDVTKAKDGDELVIEFNRATDRPDNMLANLALENAEDKFGEGATAVWNSDKKLVITLGTGSVISTSSKIIVKNVKFANGTGKLSQSNASESEAIAITGKFDGREYWIDSATKAVANGRTRITVSLTKSAIATEATNVFAICQAYNSRNTVETISAIGVPDKATNSFIFDFNATKLTDFEVVVLKGDYSNMNAGVDVYSDTIKPTTAE